MTYPMHHIAQKWDYSCIKHTGSGMFLFFFLSDGSYIDPQRIHADPTKTATDYLTTLHLTLSQLGESGWELVSVTSTGDGLYENWYFKRPSS